MNIIFALHNDAKDESDITRNKFTTKRKRERKKPTEQLSMRFWSTLYVAESKRCFCFIFYFLGVTSTDSLAFPMSLKRITGRPFVTLTEPVSETLRRHLWKWHKHACADRRTLCRDERDYIVCSSLQSASEQRSHREHDSAHDQNDRIL